MNYYLNDLEIIWSGKIGLYIDGSVFFPVLNIGFSFATMQAFKKAPREIDRLQSAETGFAKMSAPSFKNVPKTFVKVFLLALLLRSANNFKIHIVVPPF